MLSTSSCRSMPNGTSKRPKEKPRLGDTMYVSASLSRVDSVAGVSAPKLSQGTGAPPMHCVAGLVRRWLCLSLWLSTSNAALTLRVGPKRLVSATPTLSKRKFTWRTSASAGAPPANSGTIWIAEFQLAEPTAKPEISSSPSILARVPPPSEGASSEIGLSWPSARLEIAVPSSSAAQAATLMITCILHSPDGVSRRYSCRDALARTAAHTLAFFYWQLRNKPGVRADVQLTGTDRTVEPRPEA